MFNYFKQIPLNPRPWRHRWDRKSLNGVIFPNQKRYEYEEYVKSYTDFKPYNKYDMMKHYRESIHDDDHLEILDDIKQFETEAEKSKEVTLSSKKIVKTRRIPTESK